MNNGVHSGANLFHDATQRFLVHREALERVIALADVDEEGREFVWQHVAMFYDIIESEHPSSGPTLIRPD